jgi:hypothetical protein
VVVAAAGVVVIVSGFVVDDGVRVLCACTVVCAGVPGEVAGVVVHPAIKIPSTRITTMHTLKAIFISFILIRSL